MECEARMDLSHAVDWSRQALWMALVLGGPLLIAAFLVGLIVNVGQTLTQLHEPVVGLVPRLAAVTIVLLLILPWMLARWVSFAVDLIGSIPELL
jgi:flagellar biosynthesis protein FliQ